MTVTDVDDTDARERERSRSPTSRPVTSCDFTDTAEIDGTYAAGTLTLLPQSGSDADRRAVPGRPAVGHLLERDAEPEHDAADDQLQRQRRRLNSNTASKTMNVVAVNDSPALTQPDAAALTYTEDSPSENHDLGDRAEPRRVVDTDDANLGGATVQFTAGFAAAEDELRLHQPERDHGAYEHRHRRR